MLRRGYWEVLKIRPKRALRARSRTGGRRSPYFSGFLGMVQLLVRQPDQGVEIPFMSQHARGQPQADGHMGRYTVVGAGDFKALHQPAQPLGGLDRVGVVDAVEKNLEFFPAVPADQIELRWITPARAGSDLLKAQIPPRSGRWRR